MKAPQTRHERSKSSKTNEFIDARDKEGQGTTVEFEDGEGAGYEGVVAAKQQAVVAAKGGGEGKGPVKHGEEPRADEVHQRDPALGLRVVAGGGFHKMRRRYIMLLG